MRPTLLPLLAAPLLLLVALLAGCPNQADDDFWRGDGPCYLDLDGDGYGYPEAQPRQGESCGDFSGEVLNGDDCDDSSPDVHPGAVEIPDDWLDQNCDGVESVSCMPDLDGDGYGAPPNVVEADGNCDEEGLRPTWDFVDCDDSADWISPGSPEIPGDAWDSNCNGDPED